MQLTVKTLTGRKEQLNFEPDNTILMVKQTLQQQPLHLRKFPIFV